MTVQRIRRHHMIECLVKSHCLASLLVACLTLTGCCAARSNSGTALTAADIMAPYLTSDVRDLVPTIPCEKNRMSFWVASVQSYKVVLSEWNVQDGCVTHCVYGVSERGSRECMYKLCEQPIADAFVRLHALASGWREFGSAESGHCAIPPGAVPRLLIIVSGAPAIVLDATDDTEELLSTVSTMLKESIESYTPVVRAADCIDECFSDQLYISPARMIFEAIDRLATVCDAIARERSCQARKINS